MRTTRRQRTLLLATLLPVAACRPLPETTREAAEVFRGPIVLVTMSSLRADALDGTDDGGGSRTPSFDALRAEANWAGTALSSASTSAAALASVLTGLPPWRHGSRYPGAPRIEPHVTLLAERLTELGFDTAALRVDPWLAKSFGFDRGFASFSVTSRRQDVVRRLSALPAGPSFTWIQVPAPRFPLLPGPGNARPAKQRRYTFSDLLPFFDPRVDLPAALRNDLQWRYRRRLARADREIETIVRALRDAHHWDEALFILTSDHGQEIGEHGQLFHGVNVARTAIEVPLIVKLPRSFPRRPAAAIDRPVAAARVFATILDVVGAPVPPIVPPSLFYEDAPAAVSVAYFGNGSHEVSVYSDAIQLRWWCRFAAPDPDYWRLRGLAINGGDPQPFEHLLGDLERRFEAATNCDDQSSGVLASWTASSVERLPWEERPERLRTDLALVIEGLLAANTPGASRRRVSMSRKRFDELRLWGLPVRPQWSR